MGCDSSAVEEYLPPNRGGLVSKLGICILSMTPYSSSSSGHVNEYSLRNNCSVTECLPEKSSSCRDEHFWQVMKCKALSAVQRAGYCVLKELS